MITLTLDYNQVAGCDATNHRLARQLLRYPFETSNTDSKKKKKKRRAFLISQCRYKINDHRWALELLTSQKMWYEPICVLSQVHTPEINKSSFATPNTRRPKSRSQRRRQRAPTGRRQLPIPIILLHVCLISYRHPAHRSVDHPTRVSPHT